MGHKFTSATHDKKTLTAKYKMADGTIYVRKGGTIPWRLQNPCNVRPDKSGKPEYFQPLRLAVAQTASGEFGMYGCEEDGWEMERKLLRSRLYRGCNIEMMAKIHSPEKDGNDPVKYARDILADSGVSPLLTFGKMDDATLERVMKAIKKEEGYYNLKETRIERWIYTTNITVTDGIRPAGGVTFKATLGSCEYSCITDKYGRLAPIVHKTEGMTIDVKAANVEGQYETVYSAQAGNKSKNIILKRNLVQYKAHTLAHNPEPPHEKSQPKPIDYIIQSGDTLSEIAARYEVSVSELAGNNRIKDPNKIYPGQKIVIYGKKDPDDVDSGEQSPWEGNGESYPVPPNDPTASADDDSYPLDGPISPGGWIPDNSDGSASHPPRGRTPDSTSNKPKNLPTVGSKNSGKPVCPIEHEQKDAPWMEIAYKEAKERWHWGGIKEGSGGINYHTKTGASNPSMVGTLNAWCASFINYCLQCTCLPMANANSQSFSKSGNFVKIDSPVYGAIVVLHKPHTEQSGHATLVYCKTKDDEIGVLGGNQGDSVMINPLKEVYIKKLKFELIGYYVPKSYEERAKTILSNGGDLSPVYNNIKDVRQAVGSDEIISGDANTR